MGTIFDIGGGNGYVAAMLQAEKFPVVLLEPGPAGALNAINRGVKDVVRASLQDLQFNPSTVPAVGLFDVLEHIEDDVKFLKEIHSILSPQGMLYLSVPAHQKLWSDIDDESGHFRRYNLTSIQKCIQSAGFEITYASYFFRWLLAPIALFRTLPHRMGIKRKPADLSKAMKEHGADGGLLPNLALKMFQGEIDAIRNGKQISFGASCLVAARKRK